jgi:hypothetical protein
MLYSEDIEQKLSEANTNLTQAQDNLRNLQSLHQTALAKIEAISSERQSRSFEALSGTDTRQRKALDLLNAHYLTAQIEAENYASAVAEAERRLTAAEQAVATVTEQSAALKCLTNIQEFKQAALELDACLSDFLKIYARFEDAANSIRRTTNAPSRDSVRVYSRRSMASALLPQRNVWELEMIAPSARTSFLEICQQWSENATVYCKARLNGAAE